MYKWNQTKFGRSFVILIAVATAVSFLPLLGDVGVYAADGEGEAYYALPGGEGDGSGFVAEEDALSADELDAQLQGQDGAAGAADSSAEIILEEEPLPEETVSGGQAENEVEVSSECGLARDDRGLQLMGVIDEDVYGEETSGEDPSGEDPSGEDPSGEEPVIDENSIGMTAKVNSKGIATLTAHVDIQDVFFTDLYVDDDYVTDVYGETNVVVTIDMKKFPVGYHTLKLFLGSDVYDDVDGLYMFKPSVPTYIYKKPSLKLSNFTTRCSYFTYTDNYNSYYYDSSCSVYLDYKKKGKKWKAGYGPIGYGATVKRGKLSSASKYIVRTYYAKKVKYTPPKSLNAEKNPVTVTKVFKGPKSKSIGFKTAYKKTPVKSIKAKKIKQWCKKYKVRKLSSKIYWRNGYAGWGWYRKVLGTKTYKYWYTKVRITVKMKKKPGIAGVYIGEKKVKGNKKTYAANFTLSGKKKGKKIKVSVYSYMSGTYGGLSGKVLKKVKVK